MIGSTLGHYEIVDEVGRGGMGHVYRALHPALGRTVAIKTLLPHLAADAESVRRFLREARATARLDHPGVVTIYDVGEEQGTYYFAMEFLEGRALDEIVRERGPLRVESAVALVCQIADALAHAHANGILHRDVKPSNIMVDSRGRAVLTDFGIAWAVTDTRMTRTGSSVGSPEYMSPEQIQGGELDQRADLYSLGVLFYQLIVGEAPYTGDSAVTVAYKHVNAPVRSPREQNPAVPVHIDAAVRRLMSKRPEDRHPSAAALVADLGGTAVPVSGTPGVVPTFRPRRRLALALAAAMALLGLVLTVGTYAYLVGGGAPMAGRGGGPSGAPGASAGAPVTSSGAPVAVDPEPATLDTATPAETGSGDGLPADEIGPPKVVPAAESYTITSRPEGASVTLDGQLLEQSTPVAVALIPGQRYQVGLSLEGHETSGWTFALEDLTAEQRSQRSLHFPLTSAIPPGRLTVRTDYAARLEIGGRDYEVGPGSEIALAPGNYEVRIRAPEVFFDDTRRVVIESDARAALILPPTTSLRVAATPSYCRFKIDDIDVGFVPVTVRLVVGLHEFAFDWVTMGKTLSVTRDIRLDTERLFVVAPEGSGQRELE